LFLARAFPHLGIPTVLFSDAAGYQALWAGLEHLELTTAVPLIDLTITLDPAVVWHSARPVTHLVAVERCGPTAAGRNHTMRGRDITDLTAPAHLLFEGPRDYLTIGIGDGGNEIGMGKVPFATVCKNIPNGDVVACRTATDYLIVAGVSNWGAYALAAGMMVLRGNVDTSLFDADRERALLELLVERGPLVDGVSGQRTATVDGLSFEEYVRPVSRIAALLAG
jgi:hypothetical protein